MSTQCNYIFRIIPTSSEIPANLRATLAFTYLSPLPDIIIRKYLPGKQSYFNTRHNISLYLTHKFITHSCPEFVSNEIYYLCLLNVDTQKLTYGHNWYSMFNCFFSLSLYFRVNTQLQKLFPKPQLVSHSEHSITKVVSSASAYTENSLISKEQSC